MITRSDLTISQQCVQACHACIESAQTIINKEIKPYIVLCTVNDECALNACISKLKTHNIKHSTFYEPDLNSSLTAIATEPLYGKQRKLMKEYKLMKVEN